MRSGYTLFEVLCVLVVILVAFFIALPAIQPMMADNHLQAASDMVQARWNEMRNRAVAEGQPYRFAVMEHTGSFKIAPDSAEFWADGSNTVANDPETRPWVVEEKLPGNVLFLGTEVTPTGAEQPSSTGGGEWHRAVTFLPNGTAKEDVHVSFGQEGSRSLTLTLRGVTGLISADDSGKGKGP
jgi:prepilin-type N-terminal cleavage/methylation domain-containing protein